MLRRSLRLHAKATLTVVENRAFVDGAYYAGIYRNVLQPIQIVGVYMYMYASAHCSLVLKLKLNIQ